MNREALEVCAEKLRHCRNVVSGLALAMDEKTLRPEPPNRGEMEAYVGQAYLAAETLKVCLEAVNAAIDAYDHIAAGGETKK